MDKKTFSPYNLAVPGADFYGALADFGDRFLELALDRLGDILEEHGLMQVSLGAPARSSGEYAIELLTLGLLRREYGPMAMRTPGEWVDELRQLWEMRSTGGSRKEEADAARALWFRKILDLPDDDAVPCDDPTLVQWLHCTGEFVQEALRIQTWIDIADVVWSATALREASDGLAQWFLSEAPQRLGTWTAPVAQHVEGVVHSGVIREDLLLITRSECLFHLNMLGSEVMNRGFAPGFQKRHRKIVLVPGCMRARPAEQCQAKIDGLDISCVHCHCGCEVSALDQMGQSLGFQVFIVPHASSFTAWLKHWQNDADAALVAAACPLHLVPGGYEMRALGLSAQCILLEYSGCKRHWDPSGTPTRLDKARLATLMRC